MSEADKFLLGVEADFVKDGVRKNPVCPHEIFSSEPETPDGAYSKKVIAIMIGQLQGGSIIQCQIVGCEAKVDRETLEPCGGACKLAAMCLEQAFEQEVEAPLEVHVA